MFGTRGKKHPAPGGPGPMSWLLRAAVLLLVLVTFFLAWPSFTRVEREVTAKSGDYLPRRLSESIPLRQNILTTRDRLGSVALAFEGETGGRAEIDVRVYELDYSGRRIASEEPLYQTVLTEQEIHPYQDTVLELGTRGIGRGALLQLELLPRTLDASSSLSVRTVSSRTGGLSENDQTLQTLALYSVLSYHRFDTAAFLACLVLALLVVLLAFDVFRPVDRWVRDRRFWPLLAVPVFTIVTAELLNTLNTSLTLPVPVLILSYLLVLGFAAFFFLLTRHVWVAMFLTQALWITMATVNHTKIYFRGDPFFAGDFLLAGEAVTSLDQLSFHVSPRLLAAVLVLTGCLLFYRKSRWRPAYSWKFPVAAAGVALSVALLVGGLVCTDRLTRWMSIERYAWNQMANYKNNGLVLSVTGSLKNLFIDTPTYGDGDIQDMYDLPAAEAETDKPPHIIVVMSESYADFRFIRELPVSEPVMPFFDALTHRPETVSGKLLTPVFGGGTCNTEFEYLLGGSMFFFQEGVVPYDSFFHQPAHAMPSMLGEQGYHTVAVHPYLKTFWERDRVYPNLGFDTFISQDEFDERDRIRRFISDEACFDRILHELDTVPEGQQLFLYAVTMQNHFPYYPDEGNMDALERRIALTGWTDASAAELYLSLLRKSDDALQELVEQLERREEPVILVFFGDHLPGNNQELLPFYNTLFGKNLADLSLSETRKMYETPYAVWSNTGMDLPEIGNTSPNLLGARVLQAAGVRMSPYFEEIASLNGSIAAINSRMVITADGRLYDRTRLPRDLEQILNRYWVLQYDNIVQSR